MYIVYVLSIVYVLYIVYCMCIVHAIDISFVLCIGISGYSYVYMFTIIDKTKITLI